MKGTYKLAAAFVGVLIMAAVVFTNYKSETARLDSPTSAWRSSADFVDKTQYHQDLDAIDSRVATLDWQLNKLLNRPLQDESGVDALQDSQADQIAPAQPMLPASNEPATGTAANDGDYEAVDDALASEQQKTRETVAALEDTLGTEPLDQHWAPHMEQNIIAAAERPELEAGTVSNVLCRSSVCRLDIDLADAEAETRYLHALVPAAGFNDVDAFYTREERADGSLAMTVYISRDGQSLPGLAFQ